MHDINFHRAVAAASGNPIVASLVEMVSALYYERRRDTAERACDRDMRDAAEMHRRIYQAIRAHDAEDGADGDEQTHLLQASAHQAQEADDAADHTRGRAQPEPQSPTQRAAKRAGRRGTSRLMRDLSTCPAACRRRRRHERHRPGARAWPGRRRRRRRRDRPAEIARRGRGEPRSRQRGRRTCGWRRMWRTRRRSSSVRDACSRRSGGSTSCSAPQASPSASRRWTWHEDDWQRIIDTNLTGTLRACQVFGRQMMAQGSGRVITIASLSSFVGLFEVAAYAASKSACGRADARAGGRVGAVTASRSTRLLPGVFRTDLNARCSIRRAGRSS